MRRVQIGTCSGPAEAALVRAAFEAHDVHVLINAEQHASMLGGLGGAFVPLHIYVDEADAEEAAELLADLRKQDRAGEVATEPNPDDPDDEPDAEEAAVTAARANRRHRLGVMLLFGFACTATLPFTIESPAFAALLVAAFFVVAIWLMRVGSIKPKSPEIPKAQIRQR